MLARQIQQQILSIVFPPRCCLCRNEQHSRMPIADICNACTHEISGDLANRCQTCGATSQHLTPMFETCSLCREYSFKFERAHAIGNYQGLLKSQVLRMKRERCEISAFQFGRMLGNRLEKLNLDRCDIVTPIPIERRKRILRGFHAADVIAEGIRHATSLRKSNRLLYCKRQTEKQGRLSTPQRFSNLRGAFGNGRGNVQGQTILLVDDVMTSGATVNEASRVLLKAGAARVFVFVVARGARVS